MNIDLRNVSNDFETAINEVKKHHNIATNSKALEFITLRYMKLLDENKTLRKELDISKMKVRSVEYNIKNLKDALNKILE